MTRREQSIGMGPAGWDEGDLLRRIGRSGGGKAGYKQLIRELGLGGGQERRLLREQLDALVRRKRLRLLDDGRWALPEAEETQSAKPAGTGSRWDGFEAAARSGRDRLVSGRLELHRDGFGFVRTEGAAGDIFIPPVALGGAMHGDTVLVDEDPPGRDGRRSGRIARVLTRRNPTIVGIFHYARGWGRRAPRDSDRQTAAPPRGNFVTPWDERLGGPIEIPDGGERLPLVDAESAHRTIGDEARWRMPEDAGEWPLEGLAVEVEVLEFPRPGRVAIGRVIDVLGPPDAFGVDVEIVIRKHAIPHSFPAAVLAEAEERSRETPEWIGAHDPDEIARREDFRALPIVTIDGETARDFDDAVLVRSLENGHTELQVHIADVGWYVRPGSAIDTEARVRGTSVYFPDRAVPMLPHALSSGVCSLLPHQDRLVLSCVMEIDAAGEVVGYRVAEGVIHSARRMTYTAVQRALNASPRAAEWNASGKGPVTPEPSAEDLAERERLLLEQPTLPEAFDAMLQLALQLNAKRVRRGSIDFDLPEPVVEFDPEGNMKAIVRSERGWAHRLIEEFMLSANECVARWLEDAGIPSIYRIHELPDPKRILDFEEQAAGFGQTLGVGALPVKRFAARADRREQQRGGRGARPTPAHDVPERIEVTPRMYQRLVRRISGKPEERILAYLMLRSLKQARYSEKNEGHFALASPSYTHFTSPIRRYPDLVVHRLVRAMLRRGTDARGVAIRSDDRQPWTEGVAQAALQKPRESGIRKFYRGDAVEKPRRAGRIGWSAESGAAEPLQSRQPSKTQVEAPIALTELADIALESSQSERRAAEAERELIEWKKMKFMADRVGDEFSAIVLSVTKYGFFVELDEMFVEGLVPLDSLTGDFYSYRDGDRAICGARSGHCFHAGDRVEVILDRIDRQQRRLQFALKPGTEPAVVAGSMRRGKTEAKKLREAAREVEKRHQKAVKKGKGRKRK